LSPDGKKVAYLSRRDGVFHLVTANVDGTGKRSIVSGPYHAAPAWSPWGDQIAFSKMDGGVWKVFVVNVDGTGLRQIGPGYNPQWARLGRRILAVTRDSPRDVYVYDLNAGTSETVISGGTFNGLPRWSPDGGRLLIATDAGSRINVFHLERREMEEVGTMHTWSDRSYTWRPREPLQIVPSF